MGLASWLSLLHLLPRVSSACSAIVTGSLVVEQLFDIPGLGRYLIAAVQSRDYPTLVGAIFVYAATLIAVRVLAEAGYALVKPTLPPA